VLSAAGFYPVTPGSAIYAIGSSLFPEDRKSFESAFSLANDVSEKLEGVVTKEFVKSFPPKNARYVRIRALNFGKIPAWHPGSGGDAWTFVDEIIIE
jgi:hypothetical protein